MALPPTINNNTIVSNISGQVAAPAANTLSQLLDAILGPAVGIVMKIGGTWNALPSGSGFDVLQIGGNGAKWGPLSDVLNSMGPDAYARGSILIRGTTSWRAFPAGAAGSFLQSQGAADP